MDSKPESNSQGSQSGFKVDFWGGPLDGNKLGMDEMYPTVRILFPFTVSINKIDHVRQLSKKGRHIGSYHLTQRPTGAYVYVWSELQQSPAGVPA